MKKVIAIVGVVLAMGLFAACGKQTQLNDAPVGKIDDSPTFVMTNADKFPNVAFRCFGVNGIYTTTRDYDALTIVANDPKCGGDPTHTVISG